MALRLATAFVEVRATKRLLTRDLLSARALVKKNLPGFIIPIRLNLPMFARDVAKVRGMLAGAGLAGLAGGAGRGGGSQSRIRFKQIRSAELAAVAANRFLPIPLAGSRGFGNKDRLPVVGPGAGAGAGLGAGGRRRSIAQQAAASFGAAAVGGRRGFGPVRAAGASVAGAAIGGGGGGGRFGALKVAGGVGAIAGLLEGVHATKTFARFEDAFAGFRGIQRLKGVSGSELDEFSLFVRKLGKTTPRTPGQIAEAASELARGGLDLGTIRTVLPSVVDLSVAGGIGVDAAAGVAITTLRSLNVPAKEFAIAMDQIAVTAANSRLTIRNIEQSLRFIGAAASIAGMPRERLFSMIGVLSNSGLRPGQSGRLGSQLLQQFVKPQVQAKFKGLGVDLIGDNGELRRLGDIFNDFIAATKGKTDVERAGLIFGKNLEGEGLALNTRAGRAFASLLIATISDRMLLESFEDKLNNSGGALKILVDEQMDTIVSIAKIVASAFEELEIAVIAPHEEDIKRFLNNLVTFIGDVTPLIIMAGEMSQGLLHGLVAAGLGVIPGVHRPKAIPGGGTEREKASVNRKRRTGRGFGAVIDRAEAAFAARDAALESGNVVLARKKDAEGRHLFATATIGLGRTRGELAKIGSTGSTQRLRDQALGARDATEPLVGRVAELRKRLLTKEKLDEKVQPLIAGLLDGVRSLPGNAKEMAKDLTGGALGFIDLLFGKRDPVGIVHEGSNIANAAQLAGMDLRMNERAFKLEEERDGKDERASRTGRFVGIRQLGRSIQESLLEDGELKKVGNNTKLTVKELEELNKKFKAGIKVDVINLDFIGGFV